ncbi:MAG: family 10 glycosylhydrolase [Armatimonadetes bacterium]|nr:family 10 glycosylhydrolase [Armatimonadota bacterium]
MFNKRWRNGGLLGLVAVLLVMLFGSSVMAAEFRAFWVDAWGTGILNQSQVNTLLGAVGTSQGGQIRDANCNAVVVQVRRNSDACYPSSMGEPYMSGLTPSTFNALQAVINAAHDTTGGKKRIEVHAWIVAFRTSGGTVYGKHVGTPTGSLTNLDNYWPSRDNNGSEVGDKAFDPGHPLAAQYTVDVAMDIVNNFDIDGIHYDYIRFTANNQGYNPTSVARYNAQYGLSGQPASTNEQWKQWRRDQVSAVVRKIYAKIQSVKPWVKQTGAFVTWNPSPTSSTRASFQATRPYYDVYSDWDAWQEEGIMDAAMPMTYYNYASLPNDYVRWMNFEKDRKFNRHMYVGPGIYLNSLDNSLLELKMTRNASPAGNYVNGYVGYSYRVPYLSGTWANQFGSRLKNEVNQTWEDIPVMTWKSNPTKGHISGTVTYHDTGKWADGATITLTGPTNRTQICDGTGFYAFIDLSPGNYTVIASRAGYPDAIKTVNVAVGAVTGNMYVTDLQLGGVVPPVITGVGASNITGTSATINWTTSQEATSQVQYGPTASYGSSTSISTALVMTHSQTITGLTPGVTYHYRVLSSNDNGSSTSQDFTFTTLAPPAITNVTATNITSDSATITWTTNQSASSKVDYGKTTSYGLSQQNSALVNSHSINLTGLQSGTTYHYKVTSANANGSTTSADFTFATNGSVVISNVQTTNILATSATVTWTTNESSTSQVEYGTSTAYGSSTPKKTAKVMSHSVDITGLSPGTLYHFRVKSENDGGLSISNDYTFTTNTLPVISNVTAGNLTNVAATITWITNQEASTQVEYGATTSYGSSSTLDPANIKSHSASLSGLTPNTLYHYRVKSGNANGMSTSADYTFTTLDKPTISDVQADTTSTTATVTWKTNHPSDSKVKYGLTTAYGGQGVSQTEVTQHTITLTGLTASTTYHYQCISVNAYGTATSVDYTFATKSPVSEYVIDNLDPGWANTGSGSWNVGSVAEVPKIGTDYLYYKGEETATRKCTWTPDLVDPGLYDVYAFYQKGTNRNPDVTYTLHYHGGQIDSPQDQKAAVANQGDWFLIAENKPFVAGTTGYLELTNKSSDSAFVSADAARWVYKAPLDLIPPTVSISQPSVSATNSGPVTFTVNYFDNNGISGITLSDDDVIKVNTGTARGTVTVSGTGNDSRTVTISDIKGSGTLGISIVAGTATDIAGNPAPAAGPSAMFIVDNNPPTVLISAPSADAASVGPITYTLTYDGASSITLASGNVSLDKDGNVDADVAISGSGTTTRTVTLSNITGDGTLGISIAAGTATDVANNSAAAAGPSATFTVDNTVPEMDSVADEKYTTSTTSLKGWWNAVDSGSGIAGYEYAIGTTAGGTQVKDWTSAGEATTDTIGGLNLNLADTYFISARAIDNVGLISDVMTSAGVRVAKEVASIQEAKGLADGDVVALPMLPVSAKFADMFYIAQPNRTSGIRVESEDEVEVGGNVRVLGIVGIAETGERAILDAIVADNAPGTLIAPWLMTGKSIGGSAFNVLTPGITDGVGLNNLGMLVRIAGKVTTINPDGLTLDDGSGLFDCNGASGIKVWTGYSSGGATHAIVTGIVSCETVDGKVYPVILSTSVIDL